MIAKTRGGADDTVDTVVGMGRSTAAGVWPHPYVFLDGDVLDGDGNPQGSYGDYLGSLLNFTLFSIDMGSRFDVINELHCKNYISNT